MPSLFFSLNRKSFFRSAHWKQSVGIKALVAFFGFYIAISLLVLGYNLPELFGQYYPGIDPIVLFNEFVWGFLLLSALMRQIAQELPVVDALPLMGMPIKKKRIAKYVVDKSFVCFANFVPWFIVAPFAATEMANQYGAGSIWGWIINLAGLVTMDHLAAILVKRSAPARQRTIMVLYVIGVSVFAISYFGILPVGEWFGSYLLLVLEKPFLGVIPLVLCVPLYLVNIKSITDSLYLDAGILPAEKKQNNYNFSWTGKFGQLGSYISLELKMITRNKRPKTALFSVVFLLLYGFFFYKKGEMVDQDFMLVLIGLLTTGSFSISYGQFTPAWHSKYYPFIMTRNFGLREMLNAQYFLFAGTTIIAYIISTVYVVYGTKILAVNLVMGLFNIGFTGHLVLWMGSFSSKAIDLSQSSFMNYQGTGASQWVMSLAIVLLPIICFAVLSASIGANWAYAIFAAVGLLGLVFHGALMEKIILRYRDNKHRMLFAYRQ